MTRPYQDIMLELIEAVREQSGHTCVQFRMEVTGSSFSFQFENRDAFQLKSSGISMRNLRGEFVK